MISFKDVCHSYGNGVNTLDHVSFDIQDGEFVFVVGPSGAGKSTMIKLMMGEIQPTSGEVEVNNYKISKIRRRHIPHLRRTMGVVFQDFRLIESKTVYENIAFAMRVVGKPESEIRKRVKYVLTLVGLPHKADKYPNELSGGEKQRVTLARAIINAPRMIIADEPTGNVDPVMSREIMEMFSLINAQNITVVIVTHDKTLVDAYNKRVITLNTGHVVSDREGGYVL
ncbi:MAG: cell division ATP-binding protein FtsE [Clostridia bacterium]|nr:cell division ATP-binding protein FtsE [Clostridia bacterium]